MPQPPPGVSEIDSHRLGLGESRQQMCPATITLGAEATSGVSAGMSAARRASLNTSQARADRKAMTRKTLIDLLAKACALARVMKARGTALPAAFAMPASMSDQVLLTVGRQFARDAAPLEAEFTSHGVPPKLIADATAAFEAATRDRGMKRADHVAAATRIRELLAAAMLDVRRLDLIVDGQLAANTPILAVWKQARRGGEHAIVPRRQRIR